LVTDARSNGRLVDADADPDSERRSKAVVDGQPQHVDEQFLDHEEQTQLPASKSSVDDERVQQARHHHVSHQGRRAQREVDHVTQRGVPDATV